MIPLIIDGYTLSGRVAIAPWPEVVISYRPAMPEKVYQYQADIARPTGKARIDGTVKLLDGNLLSWEVAGQSSIACNEANWRKLPHPILERIADLITGYAVPEAEGDGKNS